jgi:Coenzyme PQQ synthesis protein D (PqqD)
MAGVVSLTSVCAPSDDVVARDIEGEIVIVPLVAGIGDTEDELYTLNETAHAIWRQLDGRRTLGDVVAALAEPYEGPRATLEADVVGFATEMTRRGILTARG